MAYEDKRNHQLPLQIDRYLAMLSKIYQKQKEMLYDRIIVNANFAVTPETDYDNWNGGTYGHTLTLYLPEEVFVETYDNSENIRAKICTDLNNINNIPNEYISAVSFDMQTQYTNMWRTQSPSFIEQGGPIGNDSLFRHIWKESEYIRVFLSHKTKYKVPTGRLKSELLNFGITAFVAHEDIEPSREWAREIHNALLSMNAFVGLLSEDYHDSSWTDQEIGFALGRNVPCLTIKLGKDPYGLMGQFQGLGGCSWDNLQDMAKRIYDFLVANLPNNLLLFKFAHKKYQESDSYDNSAHILMTYFDSFRELSEEQVYKICDAYMQNAQNKSSRKGTAKLQELVIRWTDKELDSFLPRPEQVPDNRIPF